MPNCACCNSSDVKLVIEETPLCSKCILSSTNTEDLCLTYDVASRRARILNEENPDYFHFPELQLAYQIRRVPRYNRKEKTQ